MKVGLARQVRKTAVIQASIQVLIIAVITLVGYFSLEKSSFASAQSVMISAGFFGALISILLSYSNVKRLKSVLGTNIDTSLALLNDIAEGREVPDQKGKMLVGGVSLKILRAVAAIDENYELRVKADKRSEGLAVALDNTDAMFMISDDKQIVTYLNRALIEMFREYSSTLRGVIPEFDSDDLIGLNLERLFSAVNIKGDYLTSDSKKITSHFKIGSVTLKFTRSPIASHQNSIEGYVYQWHDETKEELAKSEIHSVVNASISGDRDRRINVGQKQGFYLDLSCDINHLLDDVSTVFSGLDEILSLLYQGDLKKAACYQYNDSFQSTKNHFNQTVLMLNGILSSVTNSSAGIHEKSLNISKLCEDLHRRIGVQTSDVVGFSTAMETVSRAADSNSINAKKAHALSSTARKQAENGEVVVQLAITAMSDINMASSQISEIISVIDEISFQTNLLALNAAVEAAHAGDQGRGFAVVATEVRNLSQRSSEAAKEIKFLIENSVSKVNRGAALVDESGKTLIDIVKSAELVSHIFDEIDAGNQEQVRSIESLHSSVLRIEEENKQNVDISRSVVNSGKDIGSQAIGLREQLSFFNLESEAN